MTLELDQLRIIRGGRVLAEVTLTRPKGGALMLRGPNGAGKSTLLRTLAGFLRAGGGEARLGGISLSDDPEGFTSQIAYGGHLDALKPSLTALETLEFEARMTGTSRSIDHALEAMDLTHLAAEPTRILSAGQKRRLGLARFALSERPLWLLDEPTVSLDAKSTDLVSAMIRRHCDSGGMAIAATHIDMGVTEAETLTLQPPERRAEPRTDALLTGDAW